MGLLPRVKIKKDFYTSKEMPEKCGKCWVQIPHRSNFLQTWVLKFPDLFKTNVCNFIHKYHFNKLPGSLNGMFQFQRNTDQIVIRNGHDNYVVSKPKSKFISQFPRPQNIT